MRTLLMLLLLVVAFSTTANPLNMRCKAAGKEDAYQARVNYIKRQALADPHLKPETVKLLDKYSKSPDYKVLRLVRENYKCKTQRAEAPFKIRQNIQPSKTLYNLHVKYRLPEAIDFYEANKRYAYIAHTHGAHLSVVVGILMMETFGGRVMGDYPVLHTLLTKAYFYLDEDGRLSNGYNPAEEVIYALRLIQDGHVKNEESFKGSFAGAFGLTQFLPSKVYEYGKDGDGDGRIDLYNSLPDVIASTSNYLAKHGYNLDDQWGYEVNLSSHTRKQVSELNRGDSKEFYSGYSQYVVYTSRQWQIHPINVDVPVEALQSSELFRFLLTYEGRKKRERQYKGYLLGGNFASVWEYNNSVYSYALPIFWISDAIIEEFGVEKYNESLAEAIF